jgi:hypothetical protein
MLNANTLHKVKECLLYFYATTDKSSLSGGDFENIWSKVLGVVSKNTMNLFDVVYGNIGWSNKTAKFVSNKTKPNSGIDIVIKRAYPKIRSGDAKTVGDSIAMTYNDFIRRSMVKQNVTDPRSIILLRSNNDHDFIIWEEPLIPEDLNNLLWVADDFGKYTAYKNDVRLYRWTTYSDNQLYRYYQIPDHAHRFSINWSKLDLHKQIISICYSNGMSFT